MAIDRVMGGIGKMRKGVKEKKKEEADNEQRYEIAG